MKINQIQTLNHSDLQKVCCRFNTNFVRLSMKYEEEKALISFFVQNDWNWNS